MSKPLAFLVLGLLAFAATPSSAQVSPSYQAELLGRALPAECADLVGAPRSAANKDEYDKCQVTRLYLADIKKGGADKGRYPPLVDGAYAQTKNELILLQTKQHQFLP